MLTSIVKLFKSLDDLIFWIRIVGDNHRAPHNYMDGGGGEMRRGDEV